MPKYIDHEDFYSFHFYKSVDILEVAIEKVKSQTDKPVVLQEFGLPTTGEKWRRLGDQEYIYRETLKRTNRQNLEGVMFWELNDHPKSAIEDPKDEGILNMGVLKNDHSKKPAAHVVEQYYKWYCEVKEYV